MKQSDSQFTDRCPSCGGGLHAKVLTCCECNLRVEGDIQLPHLARLPAELREFAELFLVAGGSLKQIAQNLGVSYPTVRQKLDRVIEALTALRLGAHQSQNLIIDRLERGEISPQEAAQLLRQLAGNLPPSSTKPGTIAPAQTPES